MVRILLPNGESANVSPSETVEEAIKHCVGGGISSQNDYSLVFFGRKLNSDQRLADIPHLDGESRSIRLFCRKLPGVSSEKNLADVDKLRSQCRTLYQNLGEELQQKLETYMVDDNNAIFNSILKDHPELVHDPIALPIVKDLRLLVPAIIENHKFAYERPVCAKILKKTLLQFGIMQQGPADSFMAQQGANGFPGQRMPAFNNRERPAGTAPTVPNQTTGTPSITHDMLSEAMNLAFGGAPSAGPSTATPVQQQQSTPPAIAPSSTLHNAPQFGVQLEQLHEYGFTNDVENVQVLAMTDGDVEQALQILIAMREDN
ncbi:hypothetical protein niasHS_001549 [Heterodera schachtii]|uniref:UBA domain-containing protein n=1 Tax=Heterodera schachtii TaxID=97005 RepID=A0ABD2KEB1_HETSC